MAANKEVTLDQLFTELEIRAALTIWRRNTTPAREICEKIVKPSMREIDSKLGQENDPLYIAYMIEYVFNQTEKRT